MTATALQKLLQGLFRGDRRRAGRYAVALPGAAVASPGTGGIVIRDLSLTGALVEGHALPPAGTEVTLTHGTLIAPATIAWAEEGRAGLRFARPLPVEQLFTIVHSARFRRGEGLPASLAA